jgi:4-amino-4-deoxy-L-arabinose transferase-like glycosyltransferase
VDRRLFALYALVAFATATAAAIVIGGARPAGEQGVAPLVVQGIGYGCAILAALDLLAPAAHPVGADRKLGGVVLSSVAVLVVLDAFALADSGGATIGAGFLRLLCLVVIVAVAGRLLATSRTAGRQRQ